MLSCSPVINKCEASREEDTSNRRWVETERTHRGARLEEKRVERDADADGWYHYTREEQSQRDVVVSMEIWGEKENVVRMVCVCRWLLLLLC